MNESEANLRKLMEFLRKLEAELKACRAVLKGEGSERR
jgi:hypothetical protein